MGQFDSLVKVTYLFHCLQARVNHEEDKSCDLHSPFFVSPNKENTGDMKKREGLKPQGSKCLTILMVCTVSISLSASQRVKESN